MNMRDSGTENATRWRQVSRVASEVKTGLATEA